MPEKKIRLEVPRRVTITIPDEIFDLYSWMVKHEPKFGGSGTAVATELVKQGTLAMYAESLKTAPPVDASLKGALAEQSIGSYSNAVRSRSGK